MYSGNRSSSKNYLLAIIALGVVFGDIGTSPLYAFRECFSDTYGLLVTHANIFGILSLIFWSLIVVISIKYSTYVMRADNDGEGGILALIALLLSSDDLRIKHGRFVFFLGVCGAALFYGDAMITPAISVLSAVEGLKIVSPATHTYVIPVTIVILILFFLFQSRGTARVGSLFGPVMLIWFITLAILGLIWIIRAPGILWALDPIYAIEFFINNSWAGFFVLGAVFLVVTGGEALYADIGHFGKIPIRMAWYCLVLPSLLLNYFGQGALLLHSPEVVENTFFQLIPDWGVYPLIVLATLATIIASQAVVTGAFSMTTQALQMGLIPRVKILHTSSEEIGQVYVSIVNWIMLAATIFLVLNFRSSGNLASAYGLAIAMLMLITTILMFLCAVYIWKWKTSVALTVTILLIIVDLAFLGANIVKINQGGWFPFLVGAIVFFIMYSWSSGKKLLEEIVGRDEISFKDFLSEHDLNEYPHVEGTAVYMSRNPHGVPTTWLNNLKHNKVMHERTIVLCVTSVGYPRVPWTEKLTIENVAKNIFKVQARFGFMETPNVTRILVQLTEHGVEIEPDEVLFIVGHTTIIVGESKGFDWLKRKIFAFLASNVYSITKYYRIPPEKTVEIGVQINI